MFLKSVFVIPLLGALAFSSQQAPVGSLDAEIREIDEWAANPDARLVMISVMAEDLKVHRNHLILLRKQTGQTYGQLFLASLEKAGLGPSVIAARARALNREVERRLQKPSAEAQSGRSRPVRPVLTVSTGADHSSAGTFFWLTPEIGIDSKHASLSFGLPYYRNSNETTVAGVGDVYAAGAVYARAARTDLEAALLLGFPTGDKSRGLGAGKVTADVTGTVAHDFERLRPFASMGFANSIFNFAYQRPFIADGNAAHFSAGVDFRVARRLAVGFGGFAVRPFGSQIVYSRTRMAQTGGASSGSAYMPGTGMAGMPGATAGTPASTLPFLSTAQSIVPASEIADHGANGWMSFRVAPGLSLNFGVARSVPFHLTTVRLGLNFDVGRLLFH